MDHPLCNALAARAKEGDREALNALFLLVDPVLKGIAREGRPFAWEWEDSVQEARLWFLETLPIWEEDRSPFVYFLRLRVGSKFRDERRRLSARFLVYPMSDCEGVDVADIPAPDRFGPPLARAMIEWICKCCRPGKNAQLAIDAILGDITLREASLRAGKRGPTLQASFNYWRNRVRREFREVLR